jgi:hypothetical protein
MVEPIAEDLDEMAPDSDAEEGIPISEEASEKTNKFERFPGLSRTHNKPRSFGAQGTRNDSRTDIKITTSDSPTLREALSSTPTEQEIRQQSIGEEMESLQAKGTLMCSSFECVGLPSPAGSVVGGLWGLSLVCGLLPF